MAQDEEATLRRLHEYRKVFSDLVSHHNGTVFGVAGDSEMANFADAGDAVRCALQLQDDIGQRNSVLPKASRMRIRVGVNFGAVIAEGSDVYGDEVNLTARLENFAEAEEVCVSGAVFDLVRGKLECGFDFFGKQRFKNIDRPVRVYRVRTDPQAVGQVISAKRRRPQPGRYWRLAAAVSLVALLGATIWGVRVEMEKQLAAASADKLILETRQSVGEAQNQIERLLDSLQQVSDRASNEGERTNALLALLQQAQDTAENQQHLSQRRSAEIRRLLELLDASESRAAAERARADDLFKALQEVEQTTTAQNVKGWDESFSKDAVGQAGDQDLRETLLGSWREAEQQAALNQSRAQKLLTTLNKLESTARRDQDAVAEGIVLLDEPDAQISGERQRVEALLASLWEAQTITTGKREQAEDLLARLSQAEMTVADNAAALKTLQQEIAKIESLLADLMTLETKIAVDVSSAEHTLEILRKAEAAARSRTQTLFDPEPADRLGQTLDQTEQVLASVARLVHLTRAKGLSPQAERIPSQMTVYSAPVVGPDRSRFSRLVWKPVWDSTALGSSEDIGEKEAGQLSEDEIQPLAREDQQSLAQSQSSTPAQGTYDGGWTLRIHVNGYVGANLEIPVEVKNNAFSINTVVRAGNVIFTGSIDEITGKLAAEGRMWKDVSFRNVRNLIEIEANFLDGKFYGETQIPSSWKSTERLEFTLAPSQEILSNIAALRPFSHPVTDQGHSRNSVSGFYDGPWVARFDLGEFGFNKNAFEAELNVKNGSFISQNVTSSWRVYFAGKIDDKTGELSASGQIRDHQSDHTTVFGVFKTASSLVDGAYSGIAQMNTGTRMGLPQRIKYMIVRKELPEQLSAGQ